MIGSLLCSAVVFALALVAGHQIRWRVYVQHQERPELVMGRRILLTLGEFDGFCRVCGWRYSDNEHTWYVLRYAREFILPALDRHKCPTLDDPIPPGQGKWKRLR